MWPVGKEQACEAAKISKADLVRDLKELTNYNKDLASRISSLSQLEKPTVPDRVKPVAPPRPPKPTALKGAPKPAPKPVPVPRLASESYSKTVPKFEATSRSVSSDGYEVPDGFECR